VEETWWPPGQSHCFVGRRSLTAEDRLRFRSSSYEKNKNTETGFCPSTSVFPCQYHATITVFIYHRGSIIFSPSTSVFPCQYHPTFASYSFIHLPPTLYNVFLPVLQFFPVSIIPPLLHTHSSIYHPRCIMFFSQYFSFPLSVPSHLCSILIHSSTTHAV